MSNAIYQEFIRQARGEAPAYPNYTDDLMRSDVLGNTLTLDDWTWTGNRRVIEAIEQHRGLTPEQQYDRGIVSMPSRVECLLVSHKMRQLFEIEQLAKLDHFNDKGEFKISYKHDIICPTKKNGQITGLRFFTIHEMKKWK